MGISGKISSGPFYYEEFIYPGLNWFCLMLGIFTGFLLAFLAVVYLSGKAEGSVIRGRFLKIARNAKYGQGDQWGLVFIFAEVEKPTLVNRYWDCWALWRLVFDCAFGSTAVVECIEEQGNFVENLRWFSDSDDSAGLVLGSIFYCPVVRRRKLFESF